MIWAGKIIGAILGLLLAGPAGAILGFIIGHSFDTGLSKQWQHTPSQSYAQRQHTFFTATFLVMGHIAKSDGRISEHEINAARAIMVRFRLNNTLRQQAIQLFTVGKQPNFNLYQTLDRLAIVCRHHHGLLQMFLDIQLQAAYADGALNPSKKQVLKIICQRLGCAPSNFAHYQQIFGDNYSYSQSRSRQQYYSSSPSPRSKLADAYHILGISESASPNEIKRAYRRLMSQNHPDKLMAKGLPEEMLKLATEKTQKIKAAYDQVREARGF